MPTDWSNAPKDPDANRDYTMDWSGDIGTATITGATFSLVDGTVTLDAMTWDDTSVTVRVGAGTAGEIAHIKSHVVLSTGEDDEYTSPLPIIER